MAGKTYLEPEDCHVKKEQNALEPTHAQKTQVVHFPTHGLNESKEYKALPFYPDDQCAVLSRCRTKGCPPVQMLSR